MKKHLQKTFLISILTLSTILLTACSQLTISEPMVVTPTETNSPLMDMILATTTATPDTAAAPTAAPEIEDAGEPTQIVELLAETPEGETEAEGEEISSDVEPTNQPPAFDPFCVPEKPNVLLVESAFDDYPTALQAYLNAGGSPFGLENALMERGLQFRNPSSFTLDLTFDGKFDVIVTIPNPNDPADPPSGMLLVYYCDGVSYQLGFAEYSPENGSIPAVLSTLDLDNDNMNEIIYSSSLVDSFARYEQVQMISWNGAYFEKRLEGSTADLPFPVSQATDYNKDGIYQIEVVAKAVDSVEAGPTRDILHIWDYSPTDSHWYPTDVIPGPSDFRIHILQDADAALNAGDYPSAILLYQQIISSPDLRDWLQPEQERAVLAAYARFKIVVTNAMLADAAAAQAALHDMQTLYSPGQREYPYLEMAEAFWQGYGSSSSDAGCEAAREYALYYPDKVLEPIGSAVFGYANGDYAPEMVCP